LRWRASDISPVLTPRSWLFCSSPGVLFSLLGATWHEIPVTEDTPGFQFCLLMSLNPRLRLSLLPVLGRERPSRARLFRACRFTKEMESWLPPCRGLMTLPLLTDSRAAGSQPERSLADAPFSPFAPLLPPPPPPVSIPFFSFSRNEDEEFPAPLVNVLPSRGGRLF